MTEIDHYAEAEKDIAAVNDMYADDVLAGPVMARAQVHATLALADAIRRPSLPIGLPTSMPEPRLPDPARGIERTR